MQRQRKQGVYPVLRARQAIAYRPLRTGHTRPQRVHVDIRNSWHSRRLRRVTLDHLLDSAPLSRTSIRFRRPIRWLSPQSRALSAEELHTGDIWVPLARANLGRRHYPAS